MFHQQHRDAHVADPTDQTGHFGGLVDVESGGRFIQEQQPGLGGERPGHLHCPLLAKGQAGGLTIGQIGDLEQVEQFHGPCPDRPFLAPGGGQTEHAGEEAGPALHMPSHHDALERGHAMEQLDVLKGPGHAQGGDLVRFPALDGMPQEGDGPAADRQGPGNEVEERGFARTVGADHRLDTALVHLEADVVDRVQAAKPLVDRIQGQYRVSTHDRAPEKRPRSRRRRLRMPSGANSITPIRIMPKTASS